MAKILKIRFLMVLILTVFFLSACSNLINNQEINSNSSEEEVISMNTITSIPHDLQEEIDILMSLKKSGYEEMTISSFHLYLDEALFLTEGNEHIIDSYSKLTHLLSSESNSEYDFIATTIWLSLAELTASIDNETENFIYIAFRNEVIDTDDPYDIDGNKNYLSYLIIPCHVYYTIDNVDILTIDMRDKAFNEYRNSIQKVIDDVPSNDYTSESLSNNLYDIIDKITKTINNKYEGINFNIEIKDIMHKP